MESLKNQMIQGIIKWYKKVEKYGYIKYGTNKEIFFKYDLYQHNNIPFELIKNMPVRFSITKDENGKNLVDRVEIITNSENVEDFPIMKNNIVSSKIDIKDSKYTRAKNSKKTYPIKSQLGKVESEKLSNNHYDLLLQVLKSNTGDSNINIIKTLADAVIQIDDLSSYRMATSLLKYNQIDGKPNAFFYDKLQYDFYEKANNEYKFMLWYDNYISFCDIKIIKENYERATVLEKDHILKRCTFDKFDFLAQRHTIVNNGNVEVHFSKICSILLRELEKAEKSISIAVAWFTNHLLFDILCAKLEEGIKIELIMINDYINNWEFGLPFQKFIEKGGELFLSEYPDIMHHKFCIIDNKVLLNGSYNWTYYAEYRNDENLMVFIDNDYLISQFNQAFASLKLGVGNAIMDIRPFNSSYLRVFERNAYRNYLSRDLVLKVTDYRKTNIGTKNISFLNTLLEQSVLLDDNNQEAKNLKDSIEPEFKQERFIISGQKIVGDILEDPNIGSSSKADNINDRNLLENKQIGILTSRIESDRRQNSEYSKGGPSDPAQFLQHDPEVMGTYSSSNVGKPPYDKAHLVPNISSFTIPESEIKPALFKNLKLVFALDYSNSMESAGDGHQGYRLYSTGKIQKVIDMMFAISQALTNEAGVDMFLFEKTAIKLPDITETNYKDYVDKEILHKYKMNGTDIFAPIKLISETYVAGLEEPKTIFVIMITDGENNKEESNQMIKDYFKNNSNDSFFWQFVGLGSNFDFLKTLKSVASNVAFFNLSDVEQVSQDELLERVLAKFPVWFKKRTI